MLKMYLDKRSMYLGGGFILYKLLLDIFAIFALNRIMHEFFLYGYGIYFEEKRYAISWLVAIFIFGVYILYEIRQKSKDKFSDFMLLLFMLMFVIPTITLYGAGGIATGCMVLFCLFLLLFIIQFLFINKKIKSFYAPQIKCGNYLFFLVSCISFLTIAYIFVVYNNCEFCNIFRDGLYVYEKRMRFNSLANDFPLSIKYIISNINVIEIVLITYLLQTKKKVFSFFCLLLLYMHFSLAGEKTVLFSALVVAVIFFVKRYINLLNVTAFMCVIGVLALIDVAIWCNDITAVPWIGTLWRRVLFEPVHLTQCYYEYFLNSGIAPFDFMGFWNNRASVARYISNEYLFSPNGSANNGMLGGAIVEFGYLGICIMPLLLAFIIKVFDWVSVGIKASNLLPLNILITFGFINSMITTMLLTHGVIVAFCMLLCMPREKKCE